MMTLECGGLELQDTTDSPDHLSAVDVRDGGVVLFLFQGEIIKKFNALRSFSLVRVHFVLIISQVQQERKQKQ